MEIRILLLFLLSKGYSAVQSPAPNNCLPKKKIYSFDVMLSELVFSFMLKFEVKKKKRERAGGFFWGGCFPLGQESVSVRGTVA